MLFSPAAFGNTKVAWETLGLSVEKDLLEKVKGLVEKFWQQGVKVFEDCRVSAKS